jgi:TolA-binding protein
VKFLTETFGAAGVLIPVSSGEAGLIASEFGQMEQLERNLRTTQEQPIEAQTLLFLEAQQSQRHIAELEEELHVAQHELQQLHAQQEEGVAIAQRHTLES